MSYIRINEQGSDVHVYANVQGEYVCTGCEDASRRDFRCVSAHTMIAHLEGHVVAGDCVPRQVFDRLLKDTEEEPPR